MGAGSAGQEGSQVTGKKGGQAGKKEAIDRFATLIDAEAPRFAKQRRENYKAWEGTVQGMSSAMHLGVEAYYDRKTNVHNDIVCNAL